MLVYKEWGNQASTHASQARQGRGRKEERKKDYQTSKLTRLDYFSIIKLLKLYSSYYLCADYQNKNTYSSVHTLKQWFTTRWRVPLERGSSILWVIVLSIDHLKIIM